MLLLTYLVALSWAVLVTPGQVWGQHVTDTAAFRTPRDLPGFPFTYTQTVYVTVSREATSFASCFHATPGMSLCNSKHRRTRSPTETTELVDIEHLRGDHIQGRQLGVLLNWISEVVESEVVTLVSITITHISIMTTVNVPYLTIIVSATGDCIPSEFMEFPPCSKESSTKVTIPPSMQHLVDVSATSILTMVESLSSSNYNQLSTEAENMDTYVTSELMNDLTEYLDTEYIPTYLPAITEPSGFNNLINDLHIEPTSGVILSTSFTVPLKATPLTISNTIIQTSSDLTQTLLSNDLITNLTTIPEDNETVTHANLINSTEVSKEHILLTEINTSPIIESSYNHKVSFTPGLSFTQLGTTKTQEDIAEFTIATKTIEIEDSQPIYSSNIVAVSSSETFDLVDSQLISKSSSNVITETTTVTSDIKEGTNLIHIISDIFDNGITSSTTISVKETKTEPVYSTTGVTNLDYNVPGNKTSSSTGTPPGFWKPYPAFIAAPPVTSPSFQASDFTSGQLCDYSKFGPGHSSIITENRSCNIKQRGVTWQEKFQILERHNSFRAKVSRGDELRGYPGPQPSAANMRQLVWNNQLAEVAQAWANQCPYSHDCYDCRKICSRDYPIGQNIYFQWGHSRSSGWVQAIEDWYSEVLNMNKSLVDAFAPQGRTIGRYTQLLWSETREIGCGAVYYSVDYFPESKIYVCNYGTAGNLLGRYVYKKGPAATHCPYGPSRTFPELCA